MLRIVFILIVAVALQGCGARRFAPSTQSNQKVTDSSWTKVRTVARDTVITIPGDTTRISIPVYEITEVPIKKTIGRATATVSRKGENIEVSCECAEYKKKIELLETIIEKQQKIIDQQKKITSVPVKYVPWYTQTLAWIGGVALAAGIVLVALKFLKPF
jgi:hypothetical protein